MSDKKPLSDADAYDRLIAAREALTNDPGETPHADTALEAARRTLVLLQIGLVAAMDRNNDQAKDP